MNISGILVIVAPEQVEQTLSTLQTMDGIDIHHIEHSSGRIVITQEAETIQHEVDGLKKIRALPGIILAEMSYHSFENDSENVSHIPEDLENEILESVNEMGDLIS